MMQGARRQQPRRIYQLKITLEHIRPPIWRRLYVNDDTSLKKLHSIFQAAMGWFDGHLHAFRVGNVSYSSRDPEFGMGDMNFMEDERGVKLRDIAPDVGCKFRYEYDFGDGWMHLVQIEKILEQTAGITVPVCLTGRRACPPEDCGGTPGYEDFVVAIRDPAHPSHHELLEWVGGDFNPEAFDKEQINNALKHA